MLIARTSNSLLKSTIYKRFINTETITNDDVIHRVDLRVGKIVHIEQHSKANHLFIEQGQFYSGTQKEKYTLTIIYS